MACPWLSDLSVRDLIRLRQYLERSPTQKVGEFAVGVVLVTAPWVSHAEAFKSDAAVKTAIRDLAPVGLEDTFPFAAHICLHNDEDVSLFIGEDAIDNLSLPLPPSSLPAIAVVSLDSGQTLPTIAYAPLECSNIRASLIHQDKYSSSLFQRTIKKMIQKVETDMDLAVIPSMCSSALRIFIAGDRSSVGKSSVCLGMIGSLVKQGFSTNELAYIKPATQSESPQLIQLFCEEHDIACIPIGPLVYYRGFTRAFLAGETPHSSELLGMCARAVDRVSRGKKVVLVDGVGFPAVGSICGTDNASVLRACSYPCGVVEGGDFNNAAIGRRAMGVVLVGGSGVGAAVDAFNLNATYFESKDVPVLGAIFNKLSLTGFYSLENCKEQVTRYFHQLTNSKHYRPFGFLPLVPEIADRERGMDYVNFFIQVFSQHVDVSSLIAAASEVKGDDSSLTDTLRIKRVLQGDLPREKRGVLTTRLFRSRQEIEQEAVASGAKKSA